MKRRFVVCLGISYCSVEWHERTKQGWGTFKWDNDGTVVMFKSKGEGINGIETRQSNLLQITRKDGRNS
jgi:hypothetical protein